MLRCQPVVDGEHRDPGVSRQEPAGAVGALVGIISLRIKGDFLAVTTIGINFVIVAIFEYSEFFGGAYGISGIAYPMLFGLKIKKIYYLLMLREL